MVAAALGLPGTGAGASVTAEQPPEPQVVGGVEASPGAWPSQAAIVRRTSPSTEIHCGGTVISRSWVLTAAHCFERLGAGDVHVITGTQDLSRGGHRVPVVEVRRMPSWDPRTFQNDLALLLLDRPTFAPSMPLVAPGTLIAAGTEVTTAGWGSTDPGRFAPSPVLQEVTVPVVSSQYCSDQYPEEQRFDDRSMLCAGDVGNGGRDSCYGDSGGPLTRAVEGRREQVGIVSWGFECGDPVFPGVYTRLAAYTDWVRTQVRYGPHPHAVAFVNQVYLDLFGRPPTPSELWAGVVTVGRESPAAWVTGLVEGDTYQRRNAAVTRLYRAFFGREPDLPGLDYWVDQMRRGRSLAVVADLFARSPEFQRRFGSPSHPEYVRLAYRNVYGREPDEPTVAYWHWQLAAGQATRGDVMVAFSESEEHRAATRARVDTVITWAGLLRRIPTPTELARWMPETGLARVTLALGSYSYAWRF